MAKYCSNKDIDQLIRKLVKAGCHVNKRTKHNELWSPNKDKRIIFSRTPEDWRAYVKIKCELRRTGFDCRI